MITCDEVLVLIQLQRLCCNRMLCAGLDYQCKPVLVYLSTAPAQPPKEAVVLQNRFSHRIQLRLIYNACLQAREAFSSRVVLAGWIY